LNAARYRLVLCVALTSAWGGGAIAGQPPPAAPASESPHGSDAATTGAAAPNDEFIEFLGADDVGDADWWEFLKKSAPRKDQNPEPPQDAKQ